MIKKIAEYLKGKKAYIAGCLLIGLGIVEGDLTTIIEGVSVIAIRAGISKTGQ